jgi:hypothetical protein
MSEPSGDHPLRTEALTYAERILFKGIGDGGKWGAEQERKVLLPFARQLVEQGGDATREGMRLARFFESTGSQANVFAHVIRISEDPELRRQALKYILDMGDEKSRSEGLMTAARSLDKDVATHALVIAGTKLEDPINQNLVVEEGLLNDDEELARCALNVVKMMQIKDERRLSRLLRTGLRSEHPVVRERCLDLAKGFEDEAARNRVFRTARELGLVQ